MPDVGRKDPSLDKVNKSDLLLEFQRDNDMVDSMSPLHATEYVSARNALAQDCATLQLIDDDIAECQTRIARAHAQMRSLERQRDAVQRRVTIHHARLSPVRAVPDQVLQEIFQRCLPDTPYIVPNVHTAPIILTHVCRRWRAVAHNTSELWSSIALYDRGLWNHELKMYMARRWLDRSRSRSVRMSITCPPHTDFGPSGSPLCSDVFRLATAHASQLSDVCLNANRTYLRHFLDRARLPALRSIAITLHHVHRIDEPAEPTIPPLITAPLLRHISFKGTGSTVDLFPRAIFPQITHLSFDCRMTIDFALLFENFANLEHLTLALSHSRDALHFRQSAIDISSSLKTAAISSPSLRHLEICLDEGTLRSGEPGRKLETVLDQLTLPALESLAITITASLQPRYLARSGRTDMHGKSGNVVGDQEERRRSSHNAAARTAWARHPSVVSLLSRTRRDDEADAGPTRPPKFELLGLSSSSLALQLLRTAEMWA